MRKPWLLLSLATGLAASPPAAAFTLSYGGRLTNLSGEAIVGPVDLEVRFYDSASATTPVPVTPIVKARTPLADGVFQVDITELTDAELHMVFGARGGAWIEFVDRTHGVTYPRQRVSASPYALKVPVDGATMTFNSNGKLQLALPDSAPAANQFLTLDGDGKLSWQSPSDSSSRSINAGAGLSGGGNLSADRTLSLAVATSGAIGGLKATTGKLTLDGGGAITSITADALSSTLTVGSGGTGATSFTSNGVVLGGAALATTAAGAANAVLRVPSGGGAPAFGALNLASGAAVTGTLPVASGGTGATSATANYVFAGPASGGAAAPGFRALVAADIAGLTSGVAGVTSAADATAITIDSSEKVGIGTTSPTGKLHVAGALNVAMESNAFGTTSGYTAMVMGATSGATADNGGVFALGRKDKSKEPYTGLGAYDDGSTRIIYFGGGGWGLPDATSIRFFTAPTYTESNDTATERLIILSNGNVGVGAPTPSDKLHVVGNLRVQGTTDCTLGGGSGATNCTSDIRLKDNVVSIPDALSRVLAMRGVEFDWNEKSLAPGKHSIGVIAQDVEKVFPTAVVANSETGHKMVDYAVLVAPLIEAVRALEAKNRALQGALCDLNPEAALCVEDGAPAR